jgi:murein DD-endopeptidase MepM/ murein hydrolase activator NlpD
VVHISPIAGRSNYGKYVVIEHDWENSPVLSLYAHLSEIKVQPGDLVKAGSVIGQMGYTGAGITRVRAHCHLELGMQMSAHYEEWHKKFGGGVNYHGNYNGMNITGAEVARFFVEQKANPELQFSRFVGSTPVYFKVREPGRGK